MPRPAVRGRRMIRSALEFLQVSNVPAQLPGREKELQAVLDFVQQHVAAGTSGALYLYGVPGTGKTATVRAVLRQLGSADASPSSLRCVYINAMAQGSPERAFLALARELRGVSSSGGSYVRARAFLDNYFTKGGPPRAADETVLLVLDELDWFLVQRQQHLYALLDWTMQPRARLVLIAVANTMNLHERLLSRISSRMGLRQVWFEAYRADQLCAIVEDRLRGVELFDAAAVRLSAAKVAAASGDARKALAMCSRAIDLALMEAVGNAAAEENGAASAAATPSPAVRVTAKHIAAACEELSRPHTVAAVQALSLAQRVLLLAMLLMRDHPPDLRTRRALLDRSAMLFVRHWSEDEAPSLDSLDQAAEELSDRRVLRFVTPASTVASPGDLTHEVTLGSELDYEDVLWALKSDPEFEPLHLL